jgi:hypothetical protein
MSSLNQFFNKHRNTVKPYRRIKMRSHLNADTLYARIREDFDRVKDHRASNAKISLSDALMSGFAMFSLKDPSLLAFDERRREDPDSLNTVFGIKDIPCDSQMRTTLDPVLVSDDLPAPIQEYLCSAPTWQGSGKDDLAGWSLSPCLGWNRYLHIRKNGL